MNFILSAAFVYCAILVMLYIGQRSMMYFPGGDRPPVEALTDVLPETINVQPEDGIELQGFYWPAKNDLPTIIFFHGNGQAYQYWLNKLKIYREQGYGAVFTDYRGYGGQPGKPSEQGLYKDARSFIAALHAKGLKNDDLIFYGESLGTGVAIQVATEYPPKALILESAYSATIDVAKSRYWMFPLGALMKDQYLSREKIGTLTMPKFFIHASNDKTIPPRFAQTLYDAAPPPKDIKFIPNGGHNDLYDNGAALHISNFLSTLSVNEK